MTEIDRVLIRLPNWLGDLLLARPLLHALRRALPAAETVMVAPEPLLALLAGEPALARGEAWPADRSGRRALVARLRRWRPSAAVILPPSFSSAWFAWLTGAPVRIGYRHEWRGPLLTHALRRPPRGDLHLSDEQLALGAPLGARPGPAPALVLPPGGVEAADALRRRLGVERGGYAVLGPGAAYGPAKRWDAGRFAAVGRTLGAAGKAVLVCGAGAEREACAEVAGAIGPPARALAGATDLPTLAALCAEAAVAVCNDSGLAHLCAAAGAPTVVVFGSTSSAWTAPLGARVRVVQRAPACAPCFQRTCRIGYGCLAAIAVEDVIRACRELAA